MGLNLLTHNKLVEYVERDEPAQRWMNAVAIAGAAASIVLGLAYYRALERGAAATGKKE